MEKIINIEGKDVRLSNNVSWAMEYRDQFGKDIIPSIMPALAAIADIMKGIILNNDGKVDNVTLEDLVRALEGDTMMDAFIHLSGIEFVDLMNIMWAMAKAADEDIAPPKQWFKEFDTTFPIDEIAPALFELIVKGLTSSKNWTRLKTTAKNLQPLISTQSSSQDSNEDSQ